MNDFLYDDNIFHRSHRLMRGRGPSRERTCGPSSHHVSVATNAVASALARGEIAPGAEESIAGVVDTFVRAIETTKKDGSRLNLLQILKAGNYDKDNPRIILMRSIMKNLAIMKMLMIAMRSIQDTGPVTSTPPIPTAAPGCRFNHYESLCCRFAAGTAIGNNRCNSWLQAQERAAPARMTPVVTELEISADYSSFPRERDVIH